MITNPRLQIVSAVAVLAAIGTIASNSATPTAPASRKFDYDITVPLFYEGRNVGSTVIPKGSPVEVVSETATTITIRHMGNVLTIAKPGRATPKVTAQPTTPKDGAYPAIDANQIAYDAERTRMSNLRKRDLPYPVMRIEVQADGSYTYADMTYSQPYPFEKNGNTTRLYHRHQIWVVNDDNTLESQIKADPKLAGLMQEQARNLGGDAYIPGLIASKMRVIIAPSAFAISKNTPLEAVFGLIATGDPRMQSLIDYADKENASRLHVENLPAQCTRVGIREIAKELMDDKTPDEAISLRDDFEKVNVTHRAQIGNTCEIYSAYHMLDYYMRKGVIKPFSFEQFRSMVSKYGSTAGNRVGITSNGLLNLLQAIQPELKIRVREMPCMVATSQTSFEGSPQIFRAFMRHELAKGRPLWISTGDHQVVGVGLQGNPLDTLIALDSTGFSKCDHGYSSWQLSIIALATSLEISK